MSRYGRWGTEAGLPVFVYDADQSALPEAEWDPIIGPRTRRHWAVVGNRRIQMVVDNEGCVALWDANYGSRWLTAPDPHGTGVSVVEEADGTRWGSAFADWPPGSVPVRTIGPTWFSVRAVREGLVLERRIWCPEGEAPWVLIEVRLRAQARTDQLVRHIEEWALRPRFCQLGASYDSRRQAAERGVAYRVESGPAGLRVIEVRHESAVTSGPLPSIFGPPVPLLLEAVGGTVARGASDDANHPTLTLTTEITLRSGEERRLWFRFGADDQSSVDDPAALIEAWTAALAARLPRAESARAPMAAAEVPWHTALLTGGACRDGLIGGHTLDQGSAYAFVIGSNGAARDPLQHALPLVYCEPDLALSVLRNTCAWATPDGDLPYSLDGAKQPWRSVWQPSDQNLWALWLAAEYVAATGDVDAFGADLSYHPTHNAAAVPLAEHLRRQFRFFVDGVGTGEHGHVRMRNADWNDLALHHAGVEVGAMMERGESVLNSAMAAWVLPVYAGLCDRLGDGATGAEARGLGERLRQVVAGEWNGRWFRRAYGPGVDPIGDVECWLEVQPWAILCGAADGDRGRALLRTIDELLRAGSPLGARIRWPVGSPTSGGPAGESTDGGIWLAINMTLVWAAAHLDHELAWDEWRRMTLSTHAQTYPDVWEGTVSGPDCYNAPESARAGRTWGAPQFGIAMQSFPVNNLHSHAQPLLAYLRLLGVEPTPTGSLQVGGGAAFASRTFTVRADGSGRLHAIGRVRVKTVNGTVSSGPGAFSWT